MSQPQSAPFQPPSQPPKPYWTAGKIVALVLVGLLIVGVSGFATFNYLNRQNPSSGSSSICSNGAANYPNCNSCPSGQSLVNGSCVQNCRNGATNPPSCLRNSATTVSCNPSTVVVSSSPQASSTCTIFVADTSSGTVTTPAGTVNYNAPPPSNGYGSCTLIQGSCSFSYYSPTAGTFLIAATYSGDSNHASSQGQFSMVVTNPPVCANGATNYPTCTIFDTTTTLTCSPTTVHTNLTYAECTAVVTDTTIPTGHVGASGSGLWFSTTVHNGGCDLSGISAQSSACSFNVQVGTSGPSFTVYANYQGDNTHLSSSGSFDLTVIPPPSTVTVTGTVSTMGAGTHPVKIEFVNISTGISYSAVPSSGSYTITLSNFQTFNVLIDWNGAFGSSGTCSAGTLDLRSYADTWYANYSC